MTKSLALKIAIVTLLAPIIVVIVSLVNWLLYTILLLIMPESAAVFITVVSIGFTVLALGGVYIYH